MTINFGPIGAAIVAEVQNAPNSQFFFVKNGEPRHIFCHCNQGGSPDITNDGNVVLHRKKVVFPPPRNTQVMLCRMSNDPQSNDFTKARVWMVRADWEKIAWKLNFRTIFRLISHNHRTHGLLNDNHRVEVPLIEPMILGDIVARFPRHPRDPYSAKRFSAKIGRTTISSAMRWERQCADGGWAECADPRPVVDEILT